SYPALGPGPLAPSHAATPRAGGGTEPGPPGVPGPLGAGRPRGQLVRHARPIGGCDPLLARLFIGVACRKNNAVGPLGADEGEAHRQPLDRAHWHSEMRIAGDRGKVTDARARIMVAVDEVARPGRAIGYANEQVETLFLQ